MKPALVREPLVPTTQLLEELCEAGLRPPRTLTVSLTGACNLSCRHCWVDAGGTCSTSDAPAGAVRRVLEEFCQLGGTGIRFTGGEPLCHPRWRDFLLLARELGLETVALQTNAMLLDADDVAFLKGLDFAGLSLQISLDGATEASHDLVRGPGSFGATLEALLRLADAGLARRVSLFCTEMRHNLEELPLLLELARELGAASVATGALVRCGRGAADPVVAPPDPEQYLELLGRYRRDPRLRELYSQLGTTAAVEWLHPEAGPECCTFLENPYLTAAGRLYPCVMCHADPFSVTGIWDRGLTEALWEGIPLWSRLLDISRLRLRELGACRGCPERSFCGGGCLGRAWASHGNPLAPDDRCRVRRAVGAAFPRAATVS